MCLKLTSDADCFVCMCREDDLGWSTISRKRGLRRSYFPRPIKAREGTSDSGHKTLLKGLKINYFEKHNKKTP